MSPAARSSSRSPGVRLADLVGALLEQLGDPLERPILRRGVGARELDRSVLGGCAGVGDGGLSGCHPEKG